MDNSTQKVLGALVLLASLIFACVFMLTLPKIWLPTAEAKAAYARRLEAKAKQAEAQAAREWVKAEIDQASLEVSVLAKQITTMSLTATTTILLVGGAATLVIWVNKKVTTIYPNRSGQWPLVVKQGRGWLVVHDPNRALGPVTTYQTKPQSRPVAEFALQADPETMAQITGQAQAVSLIAAAAQGEGLSKQQTQHLVEIVSRPRLSAPLPEIRPSPWEPSHVERLLSDADD